MYMPCAQETFNILCNTTPPRTIIRETVDKIDKWKAEVKFAFVCNEMKRLKGLRDVTGSGEQVFLRGRDRVK